MLGLRDATRYLSGGDRPPLGLVCAHDLNRDRCSPVVKVREHAFGPDPRLDCFDELDAEFRRRDECVPWLRNRREYGADGAEIDERGDHAAVNRLGAGR